ACLGLAGPQNQTQWLVLVHISTHSRLLSERRYCDWLIGRPRLVYARLRLRCCLWRRWYLLVLYLDIRLLLLQAFRTCILKLVAEDLRYAATKARRLRRRKNFEPGASQHEVDFGKRQRVMSSVSRDLAQLVRFGS